MMTSNVGTFECTILVGDSRGLGKNFTQQEEGENSTMQLSWSSSSCIRTSSMSTEPDGEEFGKHTTFLTGRIGGMTYEAERICRPVYWLECYCFPRSLDTNELGVRRLNERLWEWVVP